MVRFGNFDQKIQDAPRIFDNLRVLFLPLSIDGTRVNVIAWKSGKDFFGKRIISVLEVRVREDQPLELKHFDPDLYRKKRGARR